MLWPCGRLRNTLRPSRPTVCASADTTGNIARQRSAGYRQRENRLALRRRPAFESLPEKALVSAGELGSRVGLLSSVNGYSTCMIIAGLIFLLLGAVLAIPLLWTIGVILVVIGLVLMLLGRTGRQVGGRAHYW